MDGHLERRIGGGRSLGTENRVALETGRRNPKGKVQALMST
jgi:hypothetical protein